MFERDICPDCGGPYPCPCGVGLEEALYHWRQEIIQDMLDKPLDLPSETEVDEMARKLGLDETPF